MIAWERENLEVRHLAFFLELTKVGQPEFQSSRVGHRCDTVRSEIGEVDMAFQARGGRLDLARLGPPCAGKFAIIAIGDIGFLAQIPKEAAAGIGYRVVVQVLALVAASGVHAGPELLHIVGSVGTRNPMMAVGTHLRIVIKVVEQDELSNQSVMVRRYLLRE